MLRPSAMCGVVEALLSTSTSNSYRPRCVTMSGVERYRVVRDGAAIVPFVLKMSQQSAVFAPSIPFSPNRWVSSPIRSGTRRRISTTTVN